HIAKSDFFVAESMHGAIPADAFRLPSVAASTSRSINDFKWNDWAASVGVTYDPRHIPVSTRAEAAAKGSRFWGLQFENRRPTIVADEATSSDILTRPEPSQTGLRGMAKQFLAAPSVLALWQASRAEPQLSSDSALEQCKDRFREVLDGIRKDYF